MTLDDNKIKFLNSQFSGLNNLAKVGLTKNDCIDEDFGDPTTLVTLQNVVNQQCGFCKTDNAVETKLCELNDQISEGADLQEFDEILQGLQNVMLQLPLQKTWQTNTKLERTNARLETELAAAVAAKIQAERQIVSSQMPLLQIRETNIKLERTNVKLETELVAAVAARTQAERQIVSSQLPLLKMRETNINLERTNARLGAELAVAVTAKTQAEGQTVLVKEMSDNLDFQRNETFFTKTKELHKISDALKQENSILTNKIQELERKIEGLKRSPLNIC